MNLLQQSIEKERLDGFQRMNLVRVLGASLFFVFFLVIDLGLQLETWTGSSFPMAIYWLLAVVAWKVPTHKFKLMRDYSLGTVDAPLFFFIQNRLMNATDDRAAIAAWSAAVFCLLIALSAYSLKTKAVAVTAFISAILQVVLHVRASQGIPAIIPSIIVLCISAIFSKLMIKRITNIVELVSHEKSKHQFFSRFFSPQVVTELMRGNQADLEVKKQTCSIMFTDIRNFTSLAEQTNSKEIFAILNEYNNVMVETIFKYEGTLDKFLGDGILAYFGAPQNHPLHAANAVLCALEIQLRIEELNETRKAQGQLNLDVGIGIHSGEAALGLIGAHNRKEYTIIGDAVNLACRIESLTKQLGTNILISETTAACVGQAVIMENLGSYKVKGRNQEVSVFFPKLIDDEASRSHTTDNSTSQHNPQVV